VFIADASVHELPSAQESPISPRSGWRRGASAMNRVAFLSYSTFGYPRGERAECVRNAVAELDRRPGDFEYEGEMGADVALSREARALYPFCRLTGPANVLVMPAAHSASISTKMLQQLGDVTVVGPLLTGLDKPVQIASMSATTSDIVNLAAIAAYDINR
jgi:malate dehydrogenase (oxaloacetate-decarboxylating)(NADP+)